MNLLNNSSAQEEETAYSRLYNEAKRLCSLEFENARLLLTEKLTLLLGRIALVAVSFVVGTAAFVFLSMSAADFLLRDLEPCWTYMIVGCFYICIVILVACLRRRLIIDPIARYISRVILNPPTAKEHAATSSAAANPTRSEQ